jgi:serine/threonine protein kinase
MTISKWGWGVLGSLLKTVDLIDRGLAGCPPTFADARGAGHRAAHPSTACGGVMKGILLNDSGGHVSPEHLRKVEELYHLVREGPVEARAALLAQADPALRSEVESLLVQHGGDGVLDRPAMEVAAKLLEDSRMELAVGASLGPYKIESYVGAGGMGQVYKARDTRLGRAVAIKVSSQEFNARFEREARAISALNHPHICTLHDIGPNYLVMELVEGPTLAERLKQGALPMESALRYGAQIADALAAAHAQGIIHRDLKPGNIIIAKGGVKVLDFGLAKSPEDETLTTSRMVMGTPAYMAPEQREGKACDARTDIYALGLVLYEMATGKRPTQDQPVLPDNLPEGLAHVIERCLDLDPEQRWQSARDIRTELDWVARPKTPAPVAKPPFNGGNKWIWITATAIASLIFSVFAFDHLTRKTPDAAAARFAVAPPFHATGLDVAVSPDGRRIAFASQNDASALWVRSVDSLNSEQLPVAGGAIRPFWSPDGRSLGFFSYVSGLKRVEASNRLGSVQTLTSTAWPNGGGVWGSAGILYSPEATGIGLYHIPSEGGTPVPVTRLNSARQEISHRYPQFLPDGRHFIYWVWSALEENIGIYAGSLDPKEKLPEGPLVRTWREAQYAEPGYLLFLQGSKLMARQFDATRLRLKGEPLALPEPVGLDWFTTGRAKFSVSQGGVLAYQEAVALPSSRIVWRDRAGKQLRSVEAPQGSYGNDISLAPDEKRIAVTGEDENALEDLWVVDLERATSLRLTSIHGSNQAPVWSPDGRRVAFHSNRNGVYDLYTMQADGSGAEELLVKSSHRKTATSWSPDGRFIVYDTLGPAGYDIWVLPLEGDRKPFPFLQTEFNEEWSRLSPVPDSHGHLWMAYTSNETGRNEIYLRPFLPGTPDGPAGSKVRVSTEGGAYPQWRRDGRELFYIHQDKLWAVDVGLPGTPQIGTPQALFECHFNDGTFSGYAPFADGHRFLFVERAGEPPTPKINVVLNWTAELKR